MLFGTDFGVRFSIFHVLGVFLDRVRAARVRSRSSTQCWLLLLVFPLAGRDKKRGVVASSVRANLFGYGALLVYPGCFMVSHQMMRAKRTRNYAYDEHSQGPSRNWCPAKSCKFQVVAVVGCILQVVVYPVSGSFRPS